MGRSRLGLARGGPRIALALTPARSRPTVRVMSKQHARLLPNTFAELLRSLHGHVVLVNLSNGDEREGTLMVDGIDYVRIDGRVLVTSHIVGIGPRVEPHGDLTTPSSR